MSPKDFTAKHIVALSGGVGGAKLALGFAKLLAPADLSIITNTADDFEHLGLPIAPDLDTVMYTLAELNNREQGWGLAGETWNFMDAMSSYEGETWFRLGDRDLATHVSRAKLLKQGYSLSEVTETLSRRLGVGQTIVPMTDDEVSTQVHTGEGDLSFQHYFVKKQCRPVVTGFHFEGVDAAKPSVGFLGALANANLKAVVFCPSNPFVSIDPILALPGIRETLAKLEAPVIAVSPLVAGQAIKGPTAKMMQELNIPLNAVSVAQHYEGVIDAFVLDKTDCELQSDVQALGIEVMVTNTVMHSLSDRIELAAAIMEFASSLSGKA